MEQANCDYLNLMTDDMTRMVLSVSNWGGSIDWLEHRVCSGTCSQSGTFSALSNLKFTSGTVAPQRPDITPTPEDDTDEYAYGDACSTTSDQDCANVDCLECNWSWPLNDPAAWDSSDALCRCMTERDSGSDDDSTSSDDYVYGDACSTTSD